MPIRSILNSIDILSRSMVLFADKCVKGLSANAENASHTAERSTSLATMVSALFGYKIGNRVANLAYEHNITCREAAEREHLLSHEAADDLFDLLSLTDVEKTEALFRQIRRNPQRLILSPTERGLVSPRWLSFFVRRAVVFGTHGPDLLFKGGNDGTPFTPALLRAASLKGKAWASLSACTCPSA